MNEDRRSSLSIMDADELTPEPIPDAEPASSVAPGVPSEPDLPAEMFPTPPGPQPWRGRDLGFFIAFLVAALLVPNFMTLVAYAIIRPLMGWRTSPQDVGSSPVFLVVVQSISYLLILAYTYGLVAVHYDLPFWSGLNWRSLRPRQMFRFVLAGIALGFAFDFAPKLLPERQDFPLEQLFNSPQSAYAIAFFAVFAAPLVEEIVFRGVLFNFFERLVGLRFAIATTALLFASLHVPEYWGAWNHVLLILVVAVVLSLTRGLTGSLAASVTVHFSYNLSQMAALFISSQQFRAVHGYLLR